MTVSANTAPTGDLLSTPHPAFGHLPRFAEKAKSGRLQLAERWGYHISNRGAPPPFSSSAGEGGGIGRRKTPVFDGLWRRMGCGPLLEHKSDCMTVSANMAPTGELLSAPHPAFGHLPRFVEKGNPAGCSSVKGV